MTTRFRLEVLCGSSDDVGRARRFFIFLGTYVDGWLADLNTAYSLPSWFSLAAFQPIPIELPAFINQYNIFKYHRIPLLPIGLVVHSLPAWNIRTYWHILIISCSIHVVSINYCTCRMHTFVLHRYCIVLHAKVHGIQVGKTPRKQDN